MCGSCIGIIELISSSGFFYCVHFHANALDKGMKPTLLSTAMGQIAGQTGFFCFG